MFGGGSFAESAYGGQSQNIDLTKFTIRVRRFAVAGRYSLEVLERARQIRRVPTRLDRIPEEIVPHQYRYVLPTQQWYWMLDKIVNRTRLRRPAPRLYEYIPPSEMPPRLDEPDSRPWKEQQGSDDLALRQDDQDTRPSRTDSESESFSKRIDDSDSYTRRPE